MKRWQTENTALRFLAAAAFAISLVVGWAFELRAESRTPAVGTLSPAALRRLGDTIRNEITTGKIPGGILLIQQHGKLVHFECFGVRDPDTGLPMTPDTIFQIYSMSKAVTSVGAMMLVDEGKLALDDSVSKYIHSFAEAKVGVDISDEAGKYPLKLEPLKRPITIRDLLRHTSGITYGFFGETQVRISITRTSPIGLQCCRLPISPQFAGITAIRPTCSAVSSKWSPGRRCTNSRSRVYSIRSACSTLLIMSRTKRSGR